MSDAIPQIEAPTELAAFLKAAGDPLRVQILRLLEQDSFGVLELAKLFDVKQSGMSHHLKLLAQAGLVATRREGNSIFYRRALAGHSAFSHLQESLMQQIDELTIEPSVLTQLEQIRVDRVASSQLFFNDNSDKFRSQQDLIASYPVYADQVTELLQQVASDPSQVALEVGPGEGEFLSELSPRFAHVWVVDINQTMLDQAAQRVDALRLSNVTMVLDDGRGIGQVVTAPVDLVVANMVLHHVPSPATMFQQLAGVVRSGGSFLVTDLCLHDQNWARESCGDVWLGFEPDQLTQWAQTSGFGAGESIYFALRNGFQIQVRQFIKY